MQGLEHWATLPGVAQSALIAMLPGLWAIAWRSSFIVVELKLIEMPTLSIYRD